MGLYINPPQITKEEFLALYGNRVTVEAIQQFQFSPTSEVLPCCLVDNGHFTALAVGFEKDETMRWFNAADHRPKKFYLVSKTIIGQWNMSGITPREYLHYVEGRES